MAFDRYKVSFINQVLLLLFISLGFIDSMKLKISSVVIAVILTALTIVPFKSVYLKLFVYKLTGYSILPCNSFAGKYLEVNSGGVWILEGEVLDGSYDVVSLDSAFGEFDKDYSLGSKKYEIKRRSGVTCISEFNALSHFERFKAYSLDERRHLLLLKCLDRWQNNPNDCVCSKFEKTIFGYFSHCLNPFEMCERFQKGHVLCIHNYSEAKKVYILGKKDIVDCLIKFFFAVCSVILLWKDSIKRNSGFKLEILMTIILSILAVLMLVLTHFHTYSDDESKVFSYTYFKWFKYFEYNKNILLNSRYCMESLGRPLHCQSGDKYAILTQDESSNVENLRFDINNSYNINYINVSVVPLISEMDHGPEMFELGSNGKIPVRIKMSTDKNSNKYNQKFYLTKHSFLKLSEILTQLQSGNFKFFRTDLVDSTKFYTHCITFNEMFMFFQTHNTAGFISQEIVRPDGNWVLSDAALNNCIKRLGYNDFQSQFFINHNIRFFGCDKIIALFLAHSRKMFYTPKGIKSSQWKKYLVDINFIKRKMGKTGKVCIDKKYKVNTWLEEFYADELFKEGLKEKAKIEKPKITLSSCIKESIKLKTEIVKAKTEQIHLKGGEYTKLKSLERECLSALSGYVKEIEALKEEGARKIERTKYLFESIHAKAKMRMLFLEQYYNSLMENMEEIVETINKRFLFTLSVFDCRLNTERQLGELFKKFQVVSGFYDSSFLPINDKDEAIEAYNKDIDEVIKEIDHCIENYHTLVESFRYPPNLESCIELDIIKSIKSYKGKDFPKAFDKLKEDSEKIDNIINVLNRVVRFESDVDILKQSQFKPVGFVKGLGRVPVSKNFSNLIKKSTKSKNNTENNNFQALIIKEFNKVLDKIISRKMSGKKRKNKNIFIKTRLNPVILRDAYLDQLIERRMLKQALKTTGKNMGCYLASGLRNKIQKICNDIIRV